MGRLLVAVALLLLAFIVLAYWASPTQTALTDPIPSGPLK
jgi:hypothetical protein